MCLACIYEKVLKLIEILIFYAKHNTRNFRRLFLPCHELLASDQSAANLLNILCFMFLQNVTRTIGTAQNGVST